MSRAAIRAIDQDVSFRRRIERMDWSRLMSELDQYGNTVIANLLSASACDELIASYEMDCLFRSKVTMARHGFGRGEYKYFADPLPEVVRNMRSTFYPPLAELANRWHVAMGIDVRFPLDHEAFLERCRKAGQSKPTPLLLRYGPGDYNCLHQDLYGEHVFPLQVTVLLSTPGDDFKGGEFVLTEQRPRMQSRVEVVPLRRGDGVIFPVRQRPVQGSRGYYRVSLKHGVSRIRTGHRHALGIIFHDAK